MGQFGPQTSCLSSPRLTHQAPTVTAWDGTLLHSSHHPHHRPGVWPGPCPRPTQNYIPPWARAVSPARLSCFHKTRPHRQAGSQPFVWKKRGLLVLTSSRTALPAHLRPCVPKPSFLIIFRASTAQCHLVSSRVARPVPSTFSYLCLPPSTQTRGSRSPRRSGTLAEVKGPFSNRQR